MTSDESDDEPLAVLAANKKLNPEKFAGIVLPKDIVIEPKRKKKKKLLPPKGLSVTIKFQSRLRNAAPPVVERPSDVWLYLKDLNPNGPYSCLLCSDWFVNRSKIIIHYVLNHKKDFCGICRYFVPDREAWWEHIKFHTPWPCSQCVENFHTENALRQHLSSAHNLVHCRLCHFRVSDDDQYNTHLFQKHNVTNVSTKDDEVLWELEFEGCTKFQCFLCSKTNNLTRMFFNHYMGYHHFTLKCFTRIISGKDSPFLVCGADVSAEFVENQLKTQTKCGYLDIENTPEGKDVGQAIKDESAIIPEVKEEIVTPEPLRELRCEVDIMKCEENEMENENENEDDISKTYKGDEDFDVTLMEMVMIQKCYFDYVKMLTNEINMNVVPKVSNIVYEKTVTEKPTDCPLCKSTSETSQEYTSHMSKMHSVKCLPIYSCRVCTSTFDTQNELDSHTNQELGNFEDLWICQFCDKEFDDREGARIHLTTHWDLIQMDNCFSPHLGFKCQYCPTLFWNETDREIHQVKVHFNKHKEEFYKCESCNEIFSDKIWYIYHYFAEHNTNKESFPMYLYKCTLCCLVLMDIHEMRNHFDGNHPEARKVFCSLHPCKYKPLSQRKSFKIHLKTIHKPSSRLDGAVSCPICTREFRSSRALSAHMAQVHGPGKFKCKICRAALNTADERKLHYLIRHPGQHPFECNECGKSFQYKSSLYMHKQEHLPNKQSYTCNFCKKVFAKKDSFREHLLIHEGPRHACSYCPMRFVQRSNMLRHERRHTGERPYACPHCERTFADKGACTSHARTHSKTQSYGCMYCGQTFVQKSKLTYHIRKHTGENLETCTVCSKIFTSACSLREHMKIHTLNKQSVKCPLCDRKYQDERYMLRHLRTSHTQGHFTCPLCRKSLTSAVGLRHHVVTHSPLKTYKCQICPKGYSARKSIVKHLRRRHGLKGNEINIRDFYNRLDPRECELGLDEELMTNIFGPPKKVMKQMLFRNFVNLNTGLDLTKKPEEKPVEEKPPEKEPPEEVTEETTNESTVEPKKPPKPIKQEVDDSEGNEELEPTDFVSVKIEPMDDESSEYII
ncbi:zinc finger protein 84 [Manduca sexta]|uniref:C2H2-type domain-containing protein n=1 Tax=Manduca sexta TaxID=7130 RepID=A0A921YS83_MANSE|nr:zinc finger protein 84 [Manduca sexta]KAG6444612.1 hypothetical protein O3G_MSEX003426 [Manduca sexta]